MSTQQLTALCEQTMESFRAYLEGDLAPEQAAALLSHLKACQTCKAEFDAQKQVISLLGEAYQEKKISPSFDQAADRKLLSLRNTPDRAALPVYPDGRNTESPFLGELDERSAGFFAMLASRLSVAPWFGVSLALHFFAILLAGLISMGMELPKADDSVIIVTELAAKPIVMEADSTQDKTKLNDALASKHETPPTDPTSKEASDIVVPPDILARAELGDHFETINPDRPDTQSAFGTPDAHMFHSVSGNDEPAGGGGMGGVGGLEDVVGVGGLAGKGSGGGWGGGHGTGLGVDKGSGRGSFGQRGGGGRRLMVKKHGGSPATEGAVDRGLEWLARNQEADGHWDTAKHQAVHGDGPKGKDTVDTAITGLALLAFLGAGHTEKVGKYKDNVIRGLKWLKAKQNYDSGAYCEWNYGHAIAGMAMAEAAGMARIPDTIESAQKAVETTAAVHKKYPGSDRGGWGYSPPQLATIRGDMSNSGWAFMFLKSAKVAGLKVPFEAIEGASRYMDACERTKVKGDPYSGHRYSYGPEEVYAKDDNRGYIAILGRLFFGTPPEQVEGGVKYMLEKRGLPPEAAKMNQWIQPELYYVYYMTLINFQVGGEVWKNWNEALKNCLPPTQIKGGVDDGSWAPGGAFKDYWGRVGQTALSILSMEIYYRYAKLN